MNFPSLRLAPQRARGNLILGTALLMAALMLVPFTLKLLFPELDLVFRVVLIFGIYSFVTQMMQSNGTLALLITGVLVYFMAFKYADLFTSLWFITIVMTMVGGTLLVTSARDFFGFGKESGGGMAHPPH